MEVKNMSQRTRILIAIVLLIVVSAGVLGVEAWRRASAGRAEPELAPGSIPITVDGKLVAGFVPADLEGLTKVSFVEPAEGVTQEGWLLRDVILIFVDTDELKADSSIRVSSSSRDKSATLTWSEVKDPANWVMFDLSNRGTLKLVSVLESLDTREEWVQDVDRIEISSR
jgi:hypothetical protein